MPAFWPFSCIRIYITLFLLHQFDDESFKKLEIDCNNTNTRDDKSLSKNVTKEFINSVHWGYVSVGQVKLGLIWFGLAEKYHPIAWSVPIAQLVEQTSLNLLTVLGVGSNPTLGRFWRFYFYKWKKGASHPKVFGLSHTWMKKCQVFKKIGHRKGPK